MQIPRFARDDNLPTLLCFLRERNFMSKRILLIFSLLLTLVCSTAAFAQTKAVDAEGHQWWQHAVFYEIYPRSFADSNNDGVGDLKGITSKMDYLHDLGIDPIYGTLANFDDMVAKGKKHHVKIILDFVVNHTSDQHPWFLDSKSSRTAPHRDWYIWRDGKGPDKPPNNWISIFGGP